MRSVQSLACFSETLFKKSLLGALACAAQVENSLLEKLYSTPQEEAANYCHQISESLFYFVVKSVGSLHLQRRCIYCFVGAGQRFASYTVSEVSI